jgi:hypothetical protein
VIILRVLQERQQSVWTVVTVQNGARLKAETRTGDRSPLAYDSGRRRRKSGGWRRWRKKKAAKTVEKTRQKGRARVRVTEGVPTRRRKRGWWSWRWANGDDGNNARRRQSARVINSEGAYDQAAAGGEA